MTGENDDRAEGLRREYEAGRIDANAYISAGGDPDVVQERARRETRAAAERKATDDKSSTRMAIGCLGVIALLLGGCWALGQAGKGGGPSPEAERHGVSRVCEKAVKQQLKDPDSAKFDWSGVTPNGGDASVFRYEGSGTVRATNSFGGTVTQAFICTGTYTVSTSEAKATAKLS